MSFLIILSLFLTLFTHSSFAIDSTASANNKVEDFVNNVLKPKVQGTITPTPVSTNPKSFFGTITQIDTNTLIMAYKGQNQTVIVNDETTYVDQKRMKSKLSAFKVGQEILAMGYLNEDLSLNCKRIVATELKTVSNNNQTVTGQIVDISQTTSVFVLIPSQNKNIQYQINTDSKTEIVDINDNDLISSKTIVNGKKIIAIISPDAKLAQTFYASKIISLDSTSSESPESTPTP